MYSNKTLRFEFENYTIPFDEKGNTKISINNCKAIARVSYFGNTGGFQSEVTLYGLGLDLISTLSAKGIGPYTDQLAHIGMKIFANDTEVFDGSIISTYANMNSVPDAGLIISAIAGDVLSKAAVKPFSIEGSQPYKEVISAICKANGYNFIPVGLDGIVGSNIHLTGSALDQIRFACDAARLSLSINGNTVTVWKQGTAVDSVIPVVSPQYGLIGYPVFTPSGITFQTQFTTYLAQGRYVKLETSLPHATGTYQLFAVDHYLSSWTKDGPWLTIAQGTKVQDGGQQQQ